MKGYIFKRLVSAALAFFVFSFIIFIIIDTMPGDALLGIMPESGMLSPAQSAEIRHELGLNRPLPVRYGSFTGSFLQGNWGYSTVYQRPAAAVIKDFLPATLWLQTPAFFMAFFTALALALYQTLHFNKRADKAIGFMLLVFQAVPVFVAAVTVQYLFVFKFRVFPLYTELFLEGSRSETAFIKSFFLPACIIYVRYTSSLTRHIKAVYLGSLRQDYMLMALAKGAGKAQLYLKHALRPVCAALVQITASYVPSLLGGTIILETVFGLPGIGGVFYQAVIGRDFILVLTLNFFFAAVLFLSGFVADIVAFCIDHRIEGDRR
jgi:peptide/nickel transport system permease protein